MNIFKRLCCNLWNDQGGVIVAAEIVMIASLLIVGVVAGLTSVRDAVVTELADISLALVNLNQSYSYSGTRGCGAYTAGSFFNDLAARDGGNSGCVVTGISFIGACAEVPRNCPTGCPCPDSGPKPVK